MPRAKELEISLLLDFYGELLSEPRREAADLYYNEDLSLAEIAEITGKTRQGVRDNIEKAREQLHLYEDKLGLAGKMREIDSTLKAVVDRLDKLGASLGKAERDELESLIGRIKSITI